MVDIVNIGGVPIVVPAGKSLFSAQVNWYQETFLDSTVEILQMSPVLDGN